MLPLLKVHQMTEKGSKTSAQVHNPTRWFFAYEPEAEWWGHGGETREECIAAAAQGDEPVWIVEAKRMVPDIASMRIFDGQQIVDQLQESEAWGEDGWEGAGDADDLTNRLNEALAKWFHETCSLDGAQLDFVHGPEKIDPRRAS